jgi:hypothetical protein
MSVLQETREVEVGGWLIPVKVQVAPWVEPAIWLAAAVNCIRPLSDKAIDRFIHLLVVHGLQVDI